VSLIMTRRYDEAAPSGVAGEGAARAKQRPKSNTPLLALTACEKWGVCAYEVFLLRCQ